MQMAGANLQGCVEDVHKECRGSAKMATLGDVHPSDLSAERDGTKRLQTRWPFTTRVVITRFQTTPFNFEFFVRKHRFGFRKKRKI